MIKITEIDMKMQRLKISYIKIIKINKVNIIFVVINQLYNKTEMIMAA